MPQGSHPGSKKCKFLTPGALLLDKRTQRMLKSPHHMQTCNVKSPFYVWPTPPPTPSGLTLIGALREGRLKSEFTRGPGRGDTCHLSVFDETLPG